MNKCVMEQESIQCDCTIRIVDMSLLQYVECIEKAYLQLFCQLYK